MAHSRRRKTQKGSGILNRFKNFVTGRKPDQVPQPIPGRNIGFRNANSAVLVDSPEAPRIVIDDAEFERLLAGLPTPAPANSVPSFLRASPLAPPSPVRSPQPLVVPPLTNPPPIAEVNRIVTAFYNLLNQSDDLRNDYALQTSEYPNPPDGQFRHPVLDELSFDPVAKQQNSTYFTIVNHIPEFDASNYAANLGPEIARGGYGTIYQHATNQRRVIKELRMRPGQTADDFLKDSVRETFIQFYLSNGVPRSVPAIYSFAKRIINPNEVSFYVEMDYLRPQNGYKSLLDYLHFQDNRNPTRTLTFDRFKRIVTNVCNRLIQLQNFAGFVHRDFKENNIMINIVTDDIKIIDFGMSFISIPGDYLIINGEGIYRPDATIRFQQDMGLFFIFLRQFFISGTEAGYPVYNDPQIRGFVELIIPPSIRGRWHFHNAYNRNGSVYANANTNILTPRAVLDALNTFARTGRISGGKRSDQKRITKKRRRTLRPT